MEATSSRCAALCMSRKSRRMTSIQSWRMTMELLEQVRTAPLKAMIRDIEGKNRRVNQGLRRGVRPARKRRVTRRGARHAWPAPRGQWMRGAARRPTGGRRSRQPPPWLRSSRPYLQPQRRCRRPTGRASSLSMCPADAGGARRAALPRPPDSSLIVHGPATSPLAPRPRGSAESSVRRPLPGGAGSSRSRYAARAGAGHAREPVDAAAPRCCSASPRSPAATDPVGQATATAVQQFGQRGRRWVAQILVGLRDVTERVEQPLRRPTVAEKRLQVSVQHVHPRSRAAVPRLRPLQGGR